jgi:two-component system osmolarity sensor histidine kinase EnvZ
VLFMRAQVRPIRQLAGAAEDFGKGRDSAGFRIEGASEVRQAAAAFNQMRDRIRRQIAQRTEMLAGVSHDLRTPLTRMKLALALLGDTPEYADLKADVAEMEKMLGGYLAFARGEGREPPAVIDLAELLREVAAAAQREGADIRLAAAPDLTLTLRPDAMRRCLTNLIGNAQRHAKSIWIAAARQDEGIEITIDDDGPGIPADKREDVFRPFFRLDTSRNPETGGIGLGLTIARDVVRGHGGDLSLLDSPHGGLRARLWLPV